jgi:myo-inositol-1(or 4)-monophosphatase
MNRQAQARLDAQIRHRINAGRVAVRDQIAFFGRQFGEVSSEWKEDDTRVTFADFAISEKLFAGLRRDFPEDDYCSEEASPQDESMDLEARFAWVVDPIDGTNNYALGCSFCAISLALLLDGSPVYGFIYDHSTEDLLEGGPGFGLFRNQKKVERSRTADEAQTMIGLHFPMSPEQMRPLEPLLTKYRVRCIGSCALTGSYLATGYLTGVVDYRAKVWDIAAAYALCRSVNLAWTFFGSSPFPLKTFHPQMGFSPYYAGAPSMWRQLSESGHPVLMPPII